MERQKSTPRDTFAGHASDTSAGSSRNASSMSSYRREMTRHVLLKFANSTTIHGVPRVIVSKSRIVRVFWCLVFLLGVSMFSYQLSEILKHYLSYPKRVNLETVDTKIPFPDITLCNMRNLDVYTLKKIFNMFDNSEKQMKDDSRRKDTSFVRYVNKYLRVYGNDKNIRSAVEEELFTRASISANFGEKVLSRAGVQKQEFIVTCSHSGHPCNINKDFALFQHSYYMNCFTYQAHQLERTKYFPAASEGMMSGWSTVVLTGGLDAFNITSSDHRTIPGLYDRRYADSGSQGVRVVIHPSNTSAFPLTEGFDIPPHASASLGVKVKQHRRLGPPHGVCSQVNPFDETQPYSRISCQKLCIQREVVQQCGCYDIMLPKPKTSNTNMFPCQHGNDFPSKCLHQMSDECVSALLRQYNRILCARNTTSTMSVDDDLMTDCDCLPACNELVYDVSYSLSEWPSEGLEGNMVWNDIFEREKFIDRFRGDGAKIGSYRAYFTFENWNAAKKDFSRINVYLSESSLLVAEEYPEYRLPNVIADIGAQLGMWIGMSVITISEILELLYQIVRYLFPRRFTLLSTNA